ncbi:MAG TPA: hypothetical protein DEG44_05895 [Candidatus Kerfeldbacteria bacterium]|nr:hypothetical protein [Candidatus Kerfeldbacteria bacterium]
MRWFVDSATVAVLPYQLNEIIAFAAILAVLFGLTVGTLLQPAEHRLWQRLRIGDNHLRLARWTGLVVMFMGVWFVHSWIELLPYVGYVTFIILNPKYPRFALALLAAGVGVSLGVLAFDEKILHPELAVTFLLDHPWNFGMSARTFVLFAGAVEFTLGTLITFGLSGRFASIIALLTFTATAIALGAIELLGHVPLVTALLVYLLQSIRTQPWSARLQP